MRKFAIIVVGQHFTGKSKTINQYLKPLLGLTGNQRNFIFGRCQGCVLSQSREESGIELNIKIYVKFDILVLAARPEFDNISKLNEIKNKLENEGFDIEEILIEKNEKNELYYQQKANKIFEIIKSCCEF